MQKLYRYIRLNIAVCIGILAVLAFCGVFYPLQFFDLQFTALLQRLVVDFSLLAAILFGGLIVFTLLFGRIYCSTLCPFGLLQELLMFIFRRRAALAANYSYKYFLAAICFGTLIGSTAYLIRLFDPYTLFGSGLSGAWIGLGAFVLIAILTWFKGRFFEAAADNAFFGRDYILPFERCAGVNCYRSIVKYGQLMLFEIFPSPNGY